MSSPCKSRTIFVINLGITLSWTSLNTSATEEYFKSVTTQNNQSFISNSGAGSFSDFHAHTLIPSFTRNRTQGNPIFPTGGSSLSMTFEYTGGFLGGTVNYFRPTLDYRYFKPMNKGRNILAVRFLGSFVQGFGGTAVPYYQRYFLGGDFDIRGFDFRAISPIAFVVRNVNVIDSETGNSVARPFDDIVYVGGDTQGVMNLEYRIPVIGRIFTIAPYFDIGNAWVLRKDQLTRRF